jgi:group I intron endonuclease
MKVLNCIYKISSEIKPEKFYIGSAVNFVKRRDRHRTSLKHNWHPNSILQNHYNKYGKDDLIFDILEFSIDINMLLNREQFYIDTLNPTFNILRTAGSNLGYIPSEETRRKLSEASKNRVFSHEEILKKKELMKGNKYKLNIPSSKKQKEIVSVLMKNNQHAKGTIRTQEFKDNLSNMYKERPFTDEAIKKSILVLSKPVLQFSKKGVFIKEWVSILEAQRVLNITHIGCCCKGKRKTAGKFKWEYKTRT